MSEVNYNNITCPECCNVGFHSVTVVNIDTKKSASEFVECHQCELVIKVEGFVIEGEEQCK